MSTDEFDHTDDFQSYDPPELEDYPFNDQISLPSSTNSSLFTDYNKPTLLGLLKGVAINLFLPFINGLMLGFGELFAHEIAFRLGWGGSKVFPIRRSKRNLSPKIDVRDEQSEIRRNELEDLTSLE